MLRHSLFGLCCGNNSSFSHCVVPPLCFINQYMSINQCEFIRLLVYNVVTGIVINNLI